MLRLSQLLDREINNRAVWFPEVVQVEKPVEINGNQQKPRNSRTWKLFGRFPDGALVTKAMLYWYELNKSDSAAGEVIMNQLSCYR